MKLRHSKLIISLGITISLAFAIFTFFLRDLGNYSEKYTQILFFCALMIYQIRYFHLIHVLKKDKVTFQLIERQSNPIFLDTIVGLFLFCMLPVFLIYVNENFNSTLGWSDIVAFMIYCIGTAITLISEKQRKDWKKINVGTLYQGGLFRYANHINYFGETLSFPSFCWLATGNIIVFLVVIMHQLIDFIFIQIPEQEAYLKSKYPNGYANTMGRKKLIPMVY